MEKNNSIGFLFDLDGVLIDSEREYTRIWDAIDDVFPTGVAGFSIKIKGMTLPEILNTYFKDERIHGAVTDMLNSLEQQMRYPWLPGAKELLETLRAEGYPRALVTSSNGMKMRHLREEVPELENYFDTIVTADKISKSKPDPEGYLLGASTLGVDPRRCVVFEDSAQGVKAGEAAGAYVIGLTTTLPSEKLKPYANRIIKDLSEVNLPELINILNAR